MEDAAITFKECIKELVRLHSRNSAGSSNPDNRSCESGRSSRIKQQPQPKTMNRNPNNPFNSSATCKPDCSISIYVPDAHSSIPSEHAVNYWQVSTLQKEIETLRSELDYAKVTITNLQEREQKLKCRLAEQAQKMLERGSKFENVSLGERRPTALVRQYGSLYAQARVDTLDALDALEPLKNADELKTKILFSVIVLSFRSIQSSLSSLREEIFTLLQVNESTEQDPALKDIETCVTVYLRKTSETFDLTKNVNEVCSQIYATLYDYPCLKKCSGLVKYAKDCVRLAWCLCNQNPPYLIDYETRTFRRDYHMRFHTSNQKSDAIKSYLWPTLVEGENGPCVHRGVVLT